MRILYLTHNVTWKGGGAFFNAFHRARHLQKRGHQVTILSISPSARMRFNVIQREGIEIVESPDLLPGLGRSGWDPWDTLRRVIHLRQGGFDIVHGNESRPVVAFPALYLQRVRHVPVVLDWMDWYGRGGTASERGKVLSKVMAPIETFFEEVFHPLADGCVAMGDPLLERALSLGIPRDRTLNLLHGCDVDGIWPTDCQEARAALGTLPGDAYVLGHLGVLRRANAILLLRAFDLIRSQVDTPCKLVLIGSHKLGGFAELVPDHCKEDVIETGWLSYQDLNFYLGACDLLLLPFKRAVSTDNIWPSKFNDYLSAGRATVATNMRVLESVFEQHKIGLLTRDEPQAFAESCLHLLADLPLRSQMARNARALAEGDLSWEHLIDRLEAFYYHMIQSV